MKVFNSKNESAIEAYPVLKNYASKIFGRDTKVQISYWWYKYIKDYICLSVKDKSNKLYEKICTKKLLKKFWWKSKTAKEKNIINILLYIK